MFQNFVRVTRNTVKNVFNVFGVEIVRIKNVPKITLAGLRDRPIKTVIDCGANRGQFADYISGFFPHASIYCFEPLDEPFQTLSAWAATQGDRVHCFNVALGDEVGTAVMHHHVDHTPSSSLLATTEHEVELFPQTARQAEISVPLTTLDTVMEDILDDIAPEILLKLDVQGFEDRVLRGADRLLEEVQACLLEVSVDPLYGGQAKFTELVSLLDRHGLEYAGNMDQTYAEDGRVMWLDALFVRR